MQSDELSHFAEMQRLELETRRLNHEEARYKLQLAKSDLSWKRKSEIHVRKMRVLESRHKQTDRWVTWLFMLAAITWFLSSLIPAILKFLRRA